LKITPAKAVLWDLDGTLVNTAKLHFKATVSTLAKYGHSFNRETFNAVFGMSDHTILRNVAPEMEEAAFEAMVIEKNALYRSLAEKDTLTALPGVLHWLKTFQEWGFCQAVVSSTFAENIETLTRKLNIAIYFDEIISTVHLNLPGKPAPDGFLKAAEMMNCSPTQCLVIEDAPAGVASAKNAGMKCLAVGTSNPLENLYAADLATPTLADLFKDEVVTLLESKYQEISNAQC